jgi:hypothetical protein
MRSELQKTNGQRLQRWPKVGSGEATTFPCGDTLRIYRPLLLVHYIDDGTAGVVNTAAKTRA